MEDRRAEVPGRLRERLVAVDLRSGLPFPRLEARQGPRGHDAPGEPQARHRHLEVLVGGQVVEGDGRRLPRVRVLDADVPAARRLQVGDRRRDRVEPVQRVAELVERQRLHVPLDVRGLPLRVAAGEGAELRRGHRQRAGPEQQVLQSHRRLAEQRVHPPVQRDGVRHLVDAADLQVVVQVLPDAGQVAEHVDAALLQQGAGADARQLQDLRRADGAGGQDHLAPRRQPLAGQQLDPGCARAGAVRFDRDAPHLRVGPHGQVRPLPDRAQERLDAAPAPAAALVHLEVGVAEVVAPVELGDLRNPALLGGVPPGVEDLPAHAPLFDPHLAAGPVAFVGAVLVVLRALEHRQHVVPAPAAVAERRPVVVVALLPAHVDHRVDRGAAAEDPPAGVADAAAVQPGVGLGPVAPVGARVADGVEVADRDVDPEVVVPPARLEQQHADAGVGGQPVGEHAPGRAGPDDDVVVRHAAILCEPIEGAGGRRRYRSSAARRRASSITASGRLHEPALLLDQAGRRPRRPRGTV